MLFKTFEKYLKVRKGAIHIGANVGEERDWYASQGITPVLWFEPNAEIFPKLVDNIKGYAGHEAFNVGVHDTLKLAKLHISNNNAQSSSILDLGTHKFHHPHVKFVRDQVVPLTRMDNFIREHNININDYNFLNIDVQGTELNVLKSFSLLLPMFDYLYIEVNLEELYVGCATLDDIDNYVARFGFERKAICMTKHRWGDAFYRSTKNNGHEA